MNFLGLTELHGLGRENQGKDVTASRSQEAQPSSSQSSRPIVMMSGAATHYLPSISVCRPMTALTGLGPLRSCLDKAGVTIAIG